MAVFFVATVLKIDWRIFMPIITKPNCLDADYFFVCKGNEILVKDNSFISKKEFEFFANETFSDDWYIEKNLSFAAALAKIEFSLLQKCIAENASGRIQQIQTAIQQFHLALLPSRSRTFKPLYRRLRRSVAAICTMA